MKKQFSLAVFLLLICFGCSDDDTNSDVTIRFSFSHVWSNDDINQTNLTSIEVTNANGELMDFTRIRYLISRFELVDVDSGTSFVFDGYKFTDLSDASTYDFEPISPGIPSGRYRLNFIWGFNENDNIDGAYPDLNSASWNWPAPLGGGYHFLQMDGQYNIDGNPSNYNFHNGTARLSTDPPVFEQNFKEISFDEIITINANSTIEITMDFAEFFVDPHTWDLNILDTPLMPNYMAQKMMQDNVATVFSLSAVSQD